VDLIAIMFSLYIFNLVLDLLDFVPQYDYKAVLCAGATVTIATNRIIYMGEEYLVYEIIWHGRLLAMIP